MLNINEKGNFKQLYDFITENKKNIYTMIFLDNKKISAAFDTCYESDNGFDFDDSKYEEFISIVMKNTENDELFEFNYHNMPIEVYSGKEKIL